ncbi:MAG TPA: diguanylate cyclase response regulator [Arthrobacter bacterium]|nr:diguanylate cyclase response regulator [Arthrobacter sp.]HAP89766.1 diguanylate cyclase response regulator [Arthrobacter sp.]HBH59459.1 diguanylate cyclase response regulator [Arthrobacter sp.]HCB58483.1 diguanylate cyclase response regulator [Arthrobacter sp.]HCC41657.1 diguanylate cyclase response regulator [Arthrobacter sp.]
MKVLVADDDPGSLLVARAAVERSGHDCLTAADGDEAWALYLEHQPDVVVTDWMMPGMDGLALCRAIRARGADLYTYIVLLTSQGSRDDVLAGLEAGADDYVTKPLDPFVLHARLLVALRVTTLHADLAHYRKVLSQQARTDPLTGLHNRLKLSEDLEQLHARSQRYAEGYCVAMCDVDNFKSYNDIYGHQAGDLALRAVAGALVGAARKSDGVYRYGGEEFLLVLPNQSQLSAKAFMERALDSVRGLEIVHAGDRLGQLTLSAGISAFTAEHTADADTLLGEADAALYAAKAAGRNRVELALH